MTRGALVLRGLQYLHDTKKIHRDVKAGNILLTGQFQPKLADFGISCQLQNTWARRNTQIGSPYWMAPEVIKGEAYNATADIWSLGITCIEMADCHPPYYHIPPTRAMFVISTKPPSGLPDPSKSSPEFVNFVSACLTVQSERPPAQVLLQHAFTQLTSEAAKEPCKALQAELGPRLALAPSSGTGGNSPSRTTNSQGGRNGSWQRLSATGTSSAAPRNPGGAAGYLPAPSLAAATPSVDAFAMAAPLIPRTPAPAAAAAPEATQGSIPPEELRRRAREWVNRIVPDVDDEIADTPESPRSLASRSAQFSDGSLVLPTKGRKQKASFEVWDSDEEGVATRTRVEAQPEAGAGGPSAAMPYFMQVLGKQLA
eukprot:s3790_g4.t1